MISSLITKIQYNLTNIIMSDTLQQVKSKGDQYIDLKRNGDQSTPITATM